MYHNIHPDTSFQYDSSSNEVQERTMRVLIADDHELVRDTIAMFLRSEGMSDVVTVESLDAAIEATEEAGSFDLVLLDYDMPGMNSMDGLRAMQKANEGRPVAVISGTVKATLANEAVSAGAAGFIPKTLGPKSMVSALRFMASGEVFVPFELMKNAEAKAVGNLTERETQVLRCLCDGKSNKEIARELDLQEVTIKLHVKTLCRKLEAKNRTQAAMIARDRNLF
jgi:DNA-binding NarL/FixJ family response regulator